MNFHPHGKVIELQVIPGVCDTYNCYINISNEFLNIFSFAEGKILAFEILSPDWGKFLEFSDLKLKNYKTKYLSFNTKEESLEFIKNILEILRVLLDERSLKYTLHNINLDLYYLLIEDKD